MRHSTTHTQVGVTSVVISMVTVYGVGPHSTKSPTPFFNSQKGSIIQHIYYCAILLSATYSAVLGKTINLYSFPGLPKKKFQHKKQGESGSAHPRPL